MATSSRGLNVSNMFHGQPERAHCRICRWPRGAAAARVRVPQAARARAHCRISRWPFQAARAHVCVHGHPARAPTSDLEVAALSRVSARVRVPRAALLVRVLEALQVTTPSRVRARAHVPRATLLAQPLENLEVAATSRVCARVHVNLPRRAAVTPLEDLEVAPPSSLSARHRVPRTALLVQPLDEPEVATPSGVSVLESRTPSRATTCDLEVPALSLRPACVCRTCSLPGTYAVARKTHRARSARVRVHSQPCSCAPWYPEMATLAAKGRLGPTDSLLAHFRTSGVRSRVSARVRVPLAALLACPLEDPRCHPALCARVRLHSSPPCAATPGSAGAHWLSAACSSQQQPCATAHFASEVAAHRDWQTRRVTALPLANAAGAGPPAASEASPPSSLPCFSAAHGPPWLEDDCEWGPQQVWAAPVRPGTTRLDDGDRSVRKKTLFPSAHEGPTRLPPLQCTR